MKGYVRYLYAAHSMSNKLEDMYNNRDFWKTQIPYYNQIGTALENERYWKDYKKNTGFTPRYPFRAYGHSGVSAAQTVYRGVRNLKRLYG